MCSSLSTPVRAVLSVYLRLHICLSSQHTDFHGIMAQKWTQMLIPVPRSRLCSLSPCPCGTASHRTCVTEVLRQEGGVSSPSFLRGWEEGSRAHPGCSAGEQPLSSSARSLGSAGCARMPLLLSRVHQALTAAFKLFKFGMKAGCNSRAMITD